MMASEAQSTARALLAEALEIDVADVADDAAIGTLASWDSLGHMRLILALESYLGEPLPPEAMVAIGSLSDVVTILEGGELSVKGW
jgi:acyl carrier protein